METTWSPSSWRDHTAAQQPDWADPGALDAAVKTLGALPPLVFAGEARSLTADLAKVADGEAFLLQAGDCAESFDAFSADAIRDKLKVILQMAVVLTYSSGVPVVKVGRIAGQFAKPRSADTETVDGVDPAVVPRPHGQRHRLHRRPPACPTPSGSCTAYHQSASTLNLLRAFTKGGFADLSRVHQWNQEFVASSAEGRRYEEVAEGIERALHFMAACGIDTESTPQLHTVDVSTSHEALILGYEEALTRRDSLTGDWYDCSAHMLWIGERTRQLDGAHVQFLSGVGNPIGCKVGPSVTPDEVVGAVRGAQPRPRPRPAHPHQPHGRRQDRGGPAAAAAGGPRRRPPGGLGLRPDARQHLHRAERPQDPPLRRRARARSPASSPPTARSAPGPAACTSSSPATNVTECLGGAEEILDADLGTRYETMCDPRLNGRQSLDLAFRVAELLQQR